MSDGIIVDLDPPISLDRDGNGVKLSWDESHGMEKVGEVDWTNPVACDGITLERDRYGIYWIKQDASWIRLTHWQLAGLVSIAQKKRG